jgi:hypothetical protein
MSDTTFLRSIVDAMRSFWGQGQRSERIAYVAGALLILSGAIHLAILTMSEGSWLGPLSLRKPTTFGLSFGLTLMTVTWAASFLQLSNRIRASLLDAFTVACALETTLVSLQAWRGVPSHFNVETTFDAWVARMLAAGGFVLVAVIVVLTFVAFRRNPTVPVSLRIAIQVGFMALVGSVVVGAFMIAKGMMLVFAGDPQSAYSTGGALKPTHAVMMHAILALPALAWLLSFANWTEQRRLRAVLLAAAGYIVSTGAVAVGNVAGIELRQLPPPASGLVAGGALLWLSITLVAIAAVARAYRRPHSAAVAAEPCHPRSRRFTSPPFREKLRLKSPR